MRQTTPAATAIAPQRQKENCRRHLEPKRSPAAASQAPPNRRTLLTLPFGPSSGSTEQHASTGPSFTMRAPHPYRTKPPLKTPHRTPAPPPRLQAP